jgi:hypothetical protein
VPPTFLENDMKLTPEVKTEIDERSYESLLRLWRFAPSGEPMFEGESGEYYKDRLAKLRSENPADAVAASARIGWGN